jgi:hypothetical protein
MCWKLASKYRHIPFRLIQYLSLEVLWQDFRMGSPWASVVFMLHIYHISSSFVMYVGHNSPGTKERREFHWYPSAIGRHVWFRYTLLPHTSIRVALLYCSCIEEFAGVETAQLESFSHIVAAMNLTFVSFALHMHICHNSGPSFQQDGVSYSLLIFH